MPVKASTLERHLVTKAPCTSLHPNPEDEFCFPEIGPNYGIISDYMQQIRHNKKAREAYPFEEPLIVEKLRPNGYMLINGHHRWAAALQQGVKTVPIRIINSASSSDIMELIKNSNHDKRVTLDLDEVVFRSDADTYIEKKPKSLSGRRFKKRIRLGMPALFLYLAKNGYDIFVYSADYYSIDDIQKLFSLYSVHVDGIITGTGNKRLQKTEAEKQMEKLIATKYARTIHIDNEMVLLTKGKKEDFEDFSIDAPEDQWSKKVMDIIGKLEKDNA